MKTKFLKTFTYLNLSCAAILNVCSSINAHAIETFSPKSCASATNDRDGYSLVFKGCDDNNAATYFDTTECVKDNVSGLIWSGQTLANTGLRATNAYKSNYDSTIGKQNYNNGEPIPATEAQINAITNSVGFKNAVNASNLCGFNDWRIPSKNELLSLVKTKERPIDNTMIDGIWFRNTHPRGLYWTSTPDNARDHYAVYVNFRIGELVSHHRERKFDAFEGYLVRLVR